MSYKGYMCQRTCTCYSMLPAVTVAPVATMFNPPVWMVVPAYLKSIGKKAVRSHSWQNKKNTRSNTVWSEHVFFTVLSVLDCYTTRVQPTCIINASSIRTLATPRPQWCRHRPSTRNPPPPSLSPCHPHETPTWECPRHRQTCLWKKGKKKAKGSKRKQKEAKGSKREQKGAKGSKREQKGAEQAERTRGVRGY